MTFQNPTMNFASLKNSPLPEIGDELGPKAQIVLRAARKVFLTHGFSAATTDMIQQEAKVSKSTVYAHFPNKEALFIAVIEAQCGAVTSAMQNVEFRAGKLRNTLAELARAYLLIILSPMGLALFRVVIAEAPRFPALARTFYLAGPAVVAGRIADLLAQAVKAGEADLGELGREAAAAQFTNLVRSEPQLQCLTHPETAPSAAQVDQWVSSAVTTFMRAYGRE